MSLKSRVIIERKLFLDQRALVLERPRITRRRSVQIPGTPHQNLSLPSSQNSRSAPNTPKSIRSILKASKSKPFTLVGPKRPINTILNYLVPIASTPTIDRIAAISPPQTPEPDNQSQNGSPQPSTSGLGHVIAVMPLSTPEPDSRIHDGDRSSTSVALTTQIEDDEFAQDILQLNESDEMLYLTDEENI